VLVVVQRWAMAPAAGTVSLGGQCGIGKEDGKSLVALVANSIREKLVPSAT
jgi:hypothetical protein